MGMTEMAERDENFKRLAQELRIAADKLNDEIIKCVRNGLSVHVETVEASTVGEEIIRPIVVVNPHYVARY